MRRSDKTLLALLGICVCSFAIGWMARGSGQPSGKVTWFCVRHPGPQMICHKGKP